MFEAFYVIQDISDANRKLEVVAEANRRVDAERVVRDRGLSGDCAVYKEQGEEIYRVICERREAVTTEAF